MVIVYLSCVLTVNSTQVFPQCPLSYRETDVVELALVLRSEKEIFRKVSATLVFAHILVPQKNSARIDVALINAFRITESLFLFRIVAR